MGNSFQKDQNKTRSLTYIDMLLLVKKGISGGTCHAIPRYAKANNR